MTKLVPLIASPVKGPLFDFMELDVDMVPVTPAACSLQHLAQCVTKPAWLADQDRPSGARPPPRPPSIDVYGRSTSSCLSYPRGLLLSTSRDLADVAPSGGPHGRRPCMNEEQMKRVSFRAPDCTRRVRV